jgi:hypothetical protein
VGYDPATKTLEVEFLKQQNDSTRRVYRYLNVPQEKFDKLMGVNMPGEHSIGAYFLVHIKPNYKFTRVEESVENEKEDQASPAEGA